MGRVDLPSPAEFGAPEKFNSWRKYQCESFQKAVDSEKRFVGLCLPTGSGKTLIYMMAAKLAGLRTCVLTSTKALQDQLLADWADSGLFDVRGQRNYPCKELVFGGRHFKKGTQTWQQGCDSGPCHSGYSCEYQPSGCHYFDAMRKAKASNLVVTNYSYWMAIHKYRDGLEPFDLLICDEAHNAEQELSSFLHIDLKAADIEGLLGTQAPASLDQEEWSKWARFQGMAINTQVENLKAQQSIVFSSETAHEIRELRKLYAELAGIGDMKGDWVIERKGKTVTFDPVWPAPYGESCLFIRTPKVILVSATIRKTTCEILGVPLDDLDFIERPSTFPVVRRPLVQVNAVRVNHQASEEDMIHWVRRIDDIIEGRQDRKGIIHTVSYARRKFLMKHTKFQHIMMTHVTENTPAVVKKFKEAKPPMILVSPSVTTGYDFPFEECRYQIIGKIPFPDNRSLVLQARCKVMKDYSNYLAMQTLVQSYGRGMRAEEDLCEVLCVDDNLKWFIFRHKEFAPKWFLDAYQAWDSLVSVPPAPSLDL
jgi:Rad3-related DNA helicase